MRFKRYIRTAKFNTVDNPKAFANEDDVKPVFSYKMNKQAAVLRSLKMKMM